MNPHSIVRMDQEMKRLQEQRLELELDQPACGCRVEWEWRWCNQQLPDFGFVSGIKPCKLHYRTASAEVIAELYQGFLNARLDRARKMSVR